MIALQMSGDIFAQDFASSSHELAEKIRAAKRWLWRKGYRIVKSYRGGFIAESCEGQVVVSIEKMTPKGVK